MTSPGGRTIGLDFDNTIVSYEKVYRRLVEKHGAEIVLGQSTAPGLPAQRPIRDSRPVWSS